jgi:hypothetical protein
VSKLKVKYYIKKGKGRAEAGIINDMDRLKMNVSDAMKSKSFVIKISSKTDEKMDMGMMIEGVEKIYEIIMLTCHECNDFVATNDEELLRHLQEEHNLEENPPLILDLHWGMIPQNA